MNEKLSRPNAMDIIFERHPEYRPLYERQMHNAEQFQQTQQERPQAETREPITEENINPKIRSVYLRTSQ
jgi:hypothetical protein